MDTHWEKKERTSCSPLIYNKQYTRAKRYFISVNNMQPRQTSEHTKISARGDKREVRLNREYAV